MPQKPTTESILKQPLILEMDPLECPFREFRDNEIHSDAWGMGTAAYRAHMQYMKMAVKTGAEMSKQWDDDQTQPLPRSVRKYLHGWVRAEELATERWEADVIVFEDDPAAKMVGADFQISHTQVLRRSSYCRKVLSICYLLERVEGLIVEHQWDNFVCSIPEGWRAKYHIYSPGLKSGGGVQHKPQLSKNEFLSEISHKVILHPLWIEFQDLLHISSRFDYLTKLRQSVQHYLKNKQFEIMYMYHHGLLQSERDLLLDRMLPRTAVLLRYLAVHLGERPGPSGCQWSPTSTILSLDKSTTCQTWRRETTSSSYFSPSASVAIADMQDGKPTAKNL